MSDDERTGVRDQAYSRWHRRKSISRYGLSTYEAWSLGQIDIDSLEYCRHCGEPLALVETQVSQRNPKPAPVMAALAHRASIPAYSVSIGLIDGQITLFRRQLLDDAETEAQPVYELSPAEYARWLVSLREIHDCPQLQGRRP